ncbi:SAM-dependent methyltransferase, partial [Klebsiella pneumoniae]|nr:SAM-dependent methyltransferase [Klebsiella pneumoniae]MDQ6318322.1 SAM-dependent methyltransferase [Klebsiella pneumoniae]
ISMYYLIHCLPGTMEDKRIVIKNAKTALTKGGILYGATILGDKVRHNSFALKLLQIYNQKGIFSNFSDSEEELKKMLSHYFENINVVVKGAVAMFSAHGKK